MHSWNLPSNNGWNMTSWMLRDVVKINRKRYLLVEVVLTGKYWNRIKFAQKDFSASDRAKEYSVILPQVLIEETALKKLHRTLLKWLKTPIHKFADTSLNLKGELGGVDSQAFSIEFGKRSDFIINIGHTACTILYKMNALAGECAYIVDQSCIQTLVDGLSSYFSNQREA